MQPYQSGRGALCSFRSGSALRIVNWAIAGRVLVTWAEVEAICTAAHCFGEGQLIFAQCHCMSTSGSLRSSREGQLLSEVRHLRAEVRRLTERVDEQADQISELSANPEEVSSISGKADRSQTEEVEVVSSG